MIVTLMGVRGSRPVSRPDTLRYGGNTTSFKVEIHGMPPIFVDGGTGLYEEGLRLIEQGLPEKIYFLTTHTHWDHILSFPYFRPLYDERCHVIFYAPTSAKRRFEELIQGQYNPHAFPVPYSQLKAKQTFIDAEPDKTYTLEAATLRTIQLNHPGTTIGWRIEGDERSVCIVTDTAPIENNYLGEGMTEAAKDDPGAFEQRFNQGLIDFMHEADLVVYDTHFDEDGIKNRRHWGHSTPRMAVENCLAAGVKRLILHHHAPEDGDGDVEKKADAAWKLVKGKNLQVEAGSEGMRIWL